MTTARIASTDLVDAQPTPRHKPRHPGRRALPYLFLGTLVLYFLTPIWWLFVASTKDVGGLFNGSAGALWFDKNFALGPNLAELFTFDGGIYLRWLGNSLFYALAGGLGATILAVLAGYGFAKFRIRGRNFFFALLLGSVMVPLTALVIPTFVLMSRLNLTDTIWAVILPSLLNPFGVYLMQVYTRMPCLTSFLTPPASMARASSGRSSRSQSRSSGQRSLPSCCSLSSGAGTITSYRWPCSPTPTCSRSRSGSGSGRVRRHPTTAAGIPSGV